MAPAPRWPHRDPMTTAASAFCYASRCSSGRIEGGPEALRDRTVFTLHPHQTIFNVSASAIVELPEAMPPQRAVLAANMNRNRLRRLRLRRAGRTSKDCHHAKRSA